MTNVWQQWQVPAEEGDESYEDWSKDELVAEAERRGLAKSGTKDEIIARLHESDAE